MIGSFRSGGPLDLDCDALIIGSGAGGACVADVLTRAGFDVVMIEEGAYTPPQFAPTSASDALLRSWRCGGLTAALGAPPVVYAEGRCVGGGTEINSAIFQRADDSLLDLWARRYSIAEFGAEALAPWYDRAARAVNASYTPLSEQGRPSDLLRAGAAKLGWRHASLERAQRQCVGTNNCSLGCPTGGKQSMSVTLLPEAIARGMRLVAECRVDRLERSGDRIVAAHGRAIDHAGRRQRVTVRAKDVFLCAGAIHTPALLQRSGLGRHFGKTLRMHPTIRAIAVFDELVDASSFRLPLQAITEFMPDQRIGGSVFTPSFFGMALADDLPRRAHLLARWRHAAVYYGMIRPQGTGRIDSLLPGQEPLVRYSHTAQDLHSIAEIGGRLAEVLFAAGARLVVPCIAGHEGWTDPAAARQELSRGIARSRLNLMTIHLFSSCIPGETGAQTVTDSFGRVRGLANLVIADASQIPEAPGCNPQGTVMALAFRSAEAFLTAADHVRSVAAAAE